MVDISTHQELYIPAVMPPSPPIPGRIIETGADKLIKIVSQEGRVELSDLAKKVGVPVDIAQEWIEFLEAEGLVTLEYSFSKTYVMLRKLSSSEIQQKQKEYANKKDAFIRRVNMSLEKVNDEVAAFNAVKDKYKQVQEQLGDEAETIREEVNLLHHFEDMKKTVDQDITRQRAESQKAVQDVHNKITEEEHRYSSMLDQMKQENIELSRESSNVQELRHEEDAIVNKVGTLQDLMKSLNTQIMSTTTGINDHEARLKQLREVASKLQKDLTDERSKNMEPLLRISQDQEQRILRLQDEIVKKVKERYDQIEHLKDKSADATAAISEFFERRTRIGQLINEIESMESDVRKELTNLILKAKAFDLSTKDSDMNKHISDLEDKFTTFTNAKAYLEDKLSKLKNIMLPEK